MASTAVRSHLVIKPTSGWQAVNLRQLWACRDLLFAFAMRDVKLRYRQTVLGILWVVLQPLIGAGIFAFVFGRVAKLDSGEIPYFVFSLASLVGWNAFNSTLAKSSGVLLQNSNLVAKIFFPRLLLPLSTVGATLIDFSVQFVMVLVVCLQAGIPPRLSMLLLPVWLLAMLSLALGIGLIAGALSVPYRDIPYILPVATQFLLYASPVAYPLASALDKLPGNWALVYQLNPLTTMLEGFRWSLLGVGTLTFGGIIYTFGFTAVLLITGVLAFRRMEKKFADVI